MGEGAVTAKTSPARRGLSLCVLVLLWIAFLAGHGSVRRHRSAGNPFGGLVAAPDYRPPAAEPGEWSTTTAYTDSTETWVVLALALLGQTLLALSPAVGARAAVSFAALVLVPTAAVIGISAGFDLFGESQTLPAGHLMSGALGLACLLAPVQAVAEFRAWWRVQTGRDPAPPPKAESPATDEPPAATDRDHAAER